MDLDRIIDVTRQWSLGRQKHQTSILSRDIAGAIHPSICKHRHLWHVIGLAIPKGENELNEAYNGIKSSSLSLPW